MTRTASATWLLSLGTTLWAATTVATATGSLGGPFLPNMQAYEDASGHVRTFNVNGAIDLGNAFFQSLGTNGRACVTCHQPSDGWTVTPEHVRDRFRASDGLDPIFRTNDGSVSTNLGFLATVMWDGRETFPGKPIHFDLSDQANGATLGHAAAAHALTDAQREEIVDFESGLFTAQADDRDAGDLGARGATGGPMALSTQPFSIGINDVLGESFNPRVFTLFDTWTKLDGPAAAPAAARHVPLIGTRDHGPDGLVDARFDRARRAIARGEAIFNTRPIAITGVRGLNNVLGVSTLQGTCTTCHDTPNVGDHSVSLPVDLGLTGEDRRTPDLPLYTFRNKTTGEIITTTDPGRALITGRWKDMSLFKGPILRGLAARPPYFHNGSADALEDVVEFYDRRFSLHLTLQEKADLVAFLRAL
jgi:cytochrome c peroxidase